MTADEEIDAPPSRRGIPLPYILLAVFVVAFPVGFVVLQSARTGLTWRQVV